MKTTELFKSWKEVFCTAPLATLKECFLDFIKAYEHPSRHYHTIEHIYDLVQQINEYPLLGENRDILLQVAFFHDAIYKPGSALNEQKSAEYALRYLRRLHVKPSIMEKVYAMIQATGNHESSNLITQLFLDMDLSILGQSLRVYQEYALQIRKEHAQFSNTAYQIGRKQFVEAMLSRNQIYNTPKYFNAFEKQARINLTYELHQL